ncbi:MAG: zinc ribbon domain-containing protein [candidate division WOR-3 bacterium]|nr:zinc ribbon domain-containing protein [candidate division WOR-3 bacterium]MDH5683788.1 zinc ribbon domain-containing protein [candidate division WOR-3 bacterium]
MPIYSYKCGECGTAFDILVGVGKDSAEPQCPKCKSKKLERILSTFAVRMGGSSSSSSCPTGTCSLSGGD